MCGGTPEVFKKDPISVEHLGPTFTWYTVLGRGKSSKMCSFVTRFAVNTQLPWKYMYRAHYCKGFM